MLSSSRGQGNFWGLEASRPRPRTSKCVLEDVLEAKDVLEDSTSAVYIYETIAPQIEIAHEKNVITKLGLQKFSKKGLQKFFFRRSLLEKTKKRCLPIFHKVSGVFQRNFNGSKIVLSSSRGQGNFRGLEAWRPRPRTSKCVLEAKDVLEDSTSVFLLSGNGISEHANRLGLSQAIEHYDNWFEFLIELYFCLGVFRSGVLL